MPWLWIVLPSTLLEKTVNITSCRSQYLYSLEFCRCYEETAQIIDHLPSACDADVLMRRKSRIRSMRSYGAIQSHPV